MTRGILFTYNIPHNDLFDFYDKLTKNYQKRLKHTFYMRIFTELKSEEDTSDITVIKVVLVLKDPDRNDNMPGKATLGIGVLSKKATFKELIQVDDMPDVQWSNKETNLNAGA